MKHHSDPGTPKVGAHMAIHPFGNLNPGAAFRDLPKLYRIHYRSLTRYG